MWQKLIEKLKRAHKSWTMWFNAGMGMLMYNWDSIMSGFPQLHGYLPENVFKYGMAALVFGNFILRIKTNKPLEQK